jgi:hypothetical protein
MKGLPRAAAKKFLLAFLLTAATLLSARPCRAPPS